MQKSMMWTLIIIAVVLVAAVIFIVSTGPGNVYSNSGNNQAGTNPGNSGTSASSETLNPGAGASGATTHNIAIQGFAFTPQTLTINAGDTVIWTNMDNVVHTVTSDSGTELQSAQLSPGQTYSHAFTTAGTYDYHCTVHTMMMGTVSVQ